MSAKADQPSNSGERTPENQINLTPPLEQRQEFMTSQQTDQTSNVKIQDNNLLVPPIFASVQLDGTVSDTNNLTHLTLTNPYDSWDLHGSGRKWTDVAQSVSAAASAETQVANATSDALIASERTEPLISAPATATADAHTRQILDIAKNSEGQKLWKGSPHERAVGNGKYGGAASVSQLLKGLGYEYADSASVSQLTQKMIANGWQLVGANDAKPGDIIFGGKVGTNWRNGGGNGRVGVVGEDGKVFYNNSENGNWSSADKQKVFGSEFGDQVWILRPPTEGPQAARAAVSTRNTSVDTSVDSRRRSDYSDQNRRPQYESTGYRDFSGRDNRPGMNDGHYPTPFDDDTSSGFNPIEIVANAIRGIGERLWALTPFKSVVRGGRLGCAASVSEVLQRSGYDYAHHAAVGGLERQLMNNGWTKAPLSQAAPGDVVVVGRSRGWRAGGGSAHVGIVGENGTVYHNSSSRGQWIKDNLQARFGRGLETFVLKPPATGRHNIDPRIFANLNPEPEVNPTPRFGMQFRHQQQRYARSDYGQYEDSGRQNRRDYGRQDYGRQDYGRDYNRNYGRQDYARDYGRDREYERDRSSRDEQRWNRDRMREDERRGDRMPRRMRERYERYMREMEGRERAERHRRRRTRW